MPVTLEDLYKVYKVKENLSKHYILFVGSYFKPNIEGISWFANKVASNINISVLVVGKDMERINGLNFPSNVKIIGGVEDLGEYYQASMAVIMPIFSGSGMKVKTAEAMMYGKPIIGTDEALRGYEIDSIEGVYRCNSEDDFIKAIDDVIRKSVFYYQPIRDYFNQFCNTEQMLKKMEALLDELLYTGRICE
jgi:glycosyltransferase involved in cell wall biosynthesis